MRDRREQRDLTARRAAREEQIVGVDMVLRGVGAHEPHGIACVLDLRGERCDARMPVFHDRDDEAALRDAAEAVGTSAVRSCFIQADPCTCTMHG